MPRTDLLDELGIYLTEKKNMQARWTSLRDILEAVRNDEAGKLEGKPLWQVFDEADDLAISTTRELA